MPTCRCKIPPTLTPHDLHIFSSLTRSSHSLQQVKPMVPKHGARFSYILFLLHSLLWVKPKGGQHSQKELPLNPFMSTSITNEVDYHFIVSSLMAVKMLNSLLRTKLSYLEAVKYHNFMPNFTLHNI